MSQGVDVLLIEEQPATSEGLALAIRQAVPAAAIAVANGGPDARTLLDQDGFGLILFDFGLPDGGGLGGLMHVLALARGVPVLVVCARYDALLVSILKSLNVAGVIAKSDPLDAVRAAIVQALSGQRVFPDDFVPAGAASDSFSQAQLRVLAALGTGQLNKQIAGDLGLTEATIKAHLSAIFRKLGVTNRTQAMLRARSLFSDPA